ncbi:carbonic anhydrase [Mycobacterium sp. DL592]|uniref:carbonic anhydrase n=1 Tax=Mycobacterium sp. DL592 TaxID=2675524 RepID=UPI00141ED4D0|nr:carbonic anhydrase [Mycobacterium sp. DL592]
MSDPMSAWQRLRAGNELFFRPVRPQRDNFHQGPPVAAVFRCADAEVASEVVFGQSWGSLLDLSTWGHVVDTGVLGTLEHAVEAYEVPLIVVLGHHNCSAMRAALRAWDTAEIPDGASRLAVEQALTSIVRRGSAADSVDSVAAAHIVSVGMSLLEKSPVIARRVDAGLCGIVCATTDHNGRIQPYATVGALGEAGDTLLECV